jgi:SAM-dependent methyltransferase
MLITLGRFRYQNRDIEFVVGDALNPPLKPSSFDVIICSALLHHFTSRLEDVFSVIHRLLRPYGTLVIIEGAYFRPNAPPPMMYLNVEKLRSIAEHALKKIVYHLNGNKLPTVPEELGTAGDKEAALLGLYREELKAKLANHFVIERELYHNWGAPCILDSLVKIEVFPIRELCISVVMRLTKAVDWLFCHSSFRRYAWCFSIIARKK